MITGPFSPGRSYMLAVTTTSASLAIDADAGSIRLVNIGPDVVFVRMGVGAQAAVLGDLAVVPNVPVTLTKGVGTNTLAVIAGEQADPGNPAPQTLYITTGEGL